MNAKTVAEIANQLGIAADNVGKLVTDLLPQFVAYWGFMVAKKALFLLLVLLVGAGIVYICARGYIKDTVRCSYFDTKEERMTKEAADVRKLNKVTAIAVVLIVLFVVAFAAIDFARVAAAPQVAIVNYILGK